MKNEAKYRIIRKDSPSGLLKYTVQKLGTNWLGRPKWKFLSWTDYPETSGVQYIKDDIENNKVEPDVYYDANGNPL